MDRHLAEFRPQLRLVVDELPPFGTKVWLVSEYGSGFAGVYHPEYGIVAWSPLPKFTPEQKRRLSALKLAGVKLSALQDGADNRLPVQLPVGQDFQIDQDQ